MVEDNSWPEAVAAALAKLGIRVHDSAVLPAARLGGAARRLIRPATGAGVLAALGAAAGDDLGPHGACIRDRGDWGIRARGPARLPASGEWHPVRLSLVCMHGCKAGIAHVNRQPP